MPTSMKRAVVKKLKRNFPGLAYFIQQRLPRHKQLRQKLDGLSTQEVFTQYYENNHWGSDESVSGGGSDISGTVTIRRELPIACKELNIRRLLDAPCGDFNWMNATDIDLDQYIGGDIVDALVTDNTQKFASDTHSFAVMDIIKDALPDADAILCRDCLIHLAPELSLKFLDNFRNSNIRYLITTSYPDITRNRPGHTGGVNEINLTLPPFNLPKPVREIADNDTKAAEVRGSRKILGIWDKQDFA